MRALGRLGLLVMAFALITMAVGWWAVAVVGVLWGWVARSDVRYPAIQAGAAAGCAWGLLLSHTFVVGEGRALVERLSLVMTAPEWMVVSATLGMGVVLAFLGGWLGSAGGRERGRHTEERQVTA